jgi:hypothetical protein
VGAVSETALNKSGPGILVCISVVPRIDGVKLRDAEQNLYVLEHRISIALRWVIDIRVRQKILDAKKNLGCDEMMVFRRT